MPGSRPGRQSADSQAGFPVFILESAVTRQKTEPNGAGLPFFFPLGGCASLFTRLPECGAKLWPPTVPGSGPALS